nr:o-succinylbenzoate--CoA ligase [Mergibacter septicus]
MMFLWQRYARQKPQDIAIVLPKQISKNTNTNKSEISSRYSTFLLTKSQLTWQELNTLIEQLSQHLKQTGVQKGSGIALIGKYSFTQVLYYLASLHSNARVLCLNPNFPASKIDLLCQQNDIDYLIDCSHESQNPFSIAITQLNNTTNLPVEILNNCPLTLTLTSGSTGQPKAVVHTLTAHLANATGVVKLMQVKAESIWLLSLPLFHVSGQAILWRWLHQASKLHLAGEEFYAALCQVTHASLVPTQLQRFLSYLNENPQQPQIQHILLGGSHIPTALTTQLHQLGICSYSGYGMTEMASTVFAKKSDTSSGVGFLLPQRKVKLVEQEVWLKGCCLALGYWQKNDHRKIKPLINATGWYQSKDKAKMINNELFIIGRFDNMFISGGENIQPEEIEAIILQQPNVEQVFILPQADQEFGHRPVAIIAFKQPFSLTLVQQLEQNLVGKLEKFKFPIRYFSLDLANTSTNGIKISRSQLALWLSRQINSN